MEVKTIREKLSEIQKRITPESIKNLNKQLDKQDVVKLNQMLHSFTALVLNSDNPKNEDIRNTIKTHSDIIENMVAAQQSSFKLEAEIGAKHKEVLREIQKAFTDATQPDNKACQPYSAILAWAQNFPFYVQHNAQLLKLTMDLNKESKDLELKNEKMQNIKGVFAQIDANVDLLRASIAEDNDRLSHYQHLNKEMHDRVNVEQQNFLNFEKNFFADLSSFVLKKKMASSMKQSMGRQ